MCFLGEFQSRFMLNVVKELYRCVYENVLHGGSLESWHFC